MSDSPDIETTITGDWRILAAIMAADAERNGRNAVYGEEGRGTGGDWIHITVFTKQGMGIVGADVYIRGTGGVSQIQVKTHADPISEWQRTLTFLGAVGDIAKSFDEMTRPSAFDVIETYYRRKAAGGKITLKQLAEETRYSLSYLKTAKRRYDAAGRWGSKRKSIVPADNSDTH